MVPAGPASPTSALPYLCLCRRPRPTKRNREFNLLLLKHLYFLPAAIFEELLFPVQFQPPRPFVRELPPPRKALEIG